MSFLSTLFQMTAVTLLFLVAIFGGFVFLAGLVTGKILGCIAGFVIFVVPVSILSHWANH